MSQQIDQETALWDPCVKMEEVDRKWGGINNLIEGRD